MNEKYDDIESIKYMTDFGFYIPQFYQKHFLRDEPTTYDLVGVVGSVPIYQTGDGKIANIETIIEECKKLESLESEKNP